MEFQFSPSSQFDLELPGVVARGHGVASGQRPDSPYYPQGTLTLQIPHFLRLGVDLRGYYRGTLNIDISPARYTLRNADVTLRQVSWTDRIPPEDFSFIACLLVIRGKTHRALIYFPHPETKVEHFQNDSILEVLAPKLTGVQPGLQTRMIMRSRQILLQR